MLLKKTFLFLILLTTGVLAHSQELLTKSFQLDWNDRSTIMRSGENVVNLPLVEGHFFNENGLPVFTQILDLQNKQFVSDFQIINTEYSNLDPSLLSNVNTANVSNEMEVELNVSFIKDKKVAVLELIPLVKEAGVYKKVLSFDLKYTVGPSDSDKRISKRVPVYKNESVLEKGTWYKFRIDTTGVFKIDKKLLQEIGVDVSGLNPKNIRLFGNGGHQLPQLNSDFRYDDLEENSIQVIGEEDGIFDDQDYILFYALGPDHWTIDSENFELTRHHTNIYEDFAYYFITTDLGPGKRISYGQPIGSDAEETVNYFHDFLLHEIESINLFANGQQWMGEDFSFQNEQSFFFDFQGLIPGSEVLVRSRGAAISFSQTSMQLEINGEQLYNLDFSARNPGSFTLANTSEKIKATTLNSSDIRLDIFYNNNGNPSSRAYLDYIEILGQKELRKFDRQFRFRNLDTEKEALVYEYRIQNSQSLEQVWDVSDHLNPMAMINSGTDSEFAFKAVGGTRKEFVAFSIDDYFVPETIENSEIDNQNLHELRDVDYMIVTADHLISEAERLADYHREQSGMNVIVIDQEKIYNEFGSGSADLTAIRDFVRYLYLNASSASSRIKYLCLFGDASFDFKDRINDNNNIVPAFQSYESFNLVTSYVTDDYFGMMDENEGGLTGFDLQDIAVGRYPVTTLVEAITAVDKTLGYYDTESFGDWRNTVTFVADDPDSPNEFILQQAVDQIAQKLETEKPAFNIKKIYCDAHQQVSSAGGELYPSVNQAIDNAVETGTLVMDYFGHGGVNGWAGERILEVPQIQKWNNLKTLPLMITVTCEFARFDNPTRPTAGEYTFLSSSGGVCNMISTSREIFIGVGQLFNDRLIENLFGFNGEDYSIAEALMHTKHGFSSDQRFFVYGFGDPAMKLAQPGPDIQLIKMNGIDLQESKDTLKALSRIELEGLVTDENGEKLSSYNGTLSATIYDKALNKTTLDNDNFGKKMEFTAVESKIFRGRASIQNGEFSFEFVVPKDIRIAYGKAKISLYAENQNSDKTGADLDITIGGIDPSAPQDTEGPIISLFMNDESFVDGGNTSESPLLYAVLEDNSGINTSITSVDHDIVAILDGDLNNPYILNDYYETDLDDFKKGKVKFPFRDLEPGLHTVQLKCWDTYNNPSESTLSFIVVNDNDLILSNVLNYPNPFVNYTEFWFNHNKPSEPLDVQVQIFTVSGKLIKTLHQSVQSEGLLSRDISWNGLDDFGNKIGKGVYVYKLHVRSQLSNSSAEKFEKLVILQ